MFGNSGLFLYIGKTASSLIMMSFQDQYILLFIFTWELSLMNHQGFRLLMNWPADDIGVEGSGGRDSDINLASPL